MFISKPMKTGQDFVLRPHRPGEMGWVVYREASVYAEEYGFNSAFEALICQVVSDFLTNFDPRRERCWIAEENGQPIGHVFLTRHPTDASTARLRLLMVEACARGKGAGRALVNECIQFARECGYGKITLWTQSILAPAIAIYKSHGFQLVSEEPHDRFGPPLTGQTWELQL